MIDAEPEYSLYSENLLKRLYYGERGGAGLMFYSREYFTGVYKKVDNRGAFPEKNNEGGI